MAPSTTRAEVLESLRSQIESGKPIVGAGAGIGLSAKFVEEGGADMILVYNSGRYRMAGRGSLAGLMPYGDANGTVLDMAGEILNIVTHAPVLAGVCATDPYRHIPTFLRQLQSLGFCGIQNFPTVGLIDGTFRANLEATGMSYDAEVEMIRSARELDLVTTPYVFDVEQGEKMTKAGADVVVVHLGLTVGGSIGLKQGNEGGAMGLDEGVKLIQEIRDACVKIREDVIVLCHGGPVSGLKETQYVLERVKGLHGFYGASSMERLPVETAIAENAKAFKALKMQ